MKKNIKQEIIQIFKKYKPLFLRGQKSIGLTEYEKAYGYTESNRNGSRHFNNVFGRLMEEIYCLNSNYKKCVNDTKYIISHCDLYSKDSLVECKSKFDIFDIIKGSDIYKTVLPAVADRKRKD